MAQGRVDQITVATALAYHDRRLRALEATSPAPASAALPFAYAVSAQTEVPGDGTETPFDLTGGTFETSDGTIFSLADVGDGTKGLQISAQGSYVLAIGLELFDNVDGHVVDPYTAAVQMSIAYGSFDEEINEIGPLQITGTPNVAGGSGSIWQPGITTNLQITSGQAGSGPIEIVGTQDTGNTLKGQASILVFLINPTPIES